MKKVLPLLFISTMASLMGTAQIPGILAQRNLGSLNFENGRGLIQTSDGGYLAVGEGSFANTSDYSPTPYGGGTVDGTVAKLDASFNIQWAYYVGTTSDLESFGSCTQVSAGNYILAGSVSDAANNGVSLPNYHGGNDAYLACFAPNGTRLWHNCFGTPNNESASSVCRTDNDGGVAFAGSLGNDAWVVKLDANGNQMWSRTYGGSDIDAFKCITQTADMGFLVVGNTRSNDGDVSGYHGGNGDAWVVKLDASGDIEWQTCVGGSQTDGAASAAYVSGAAIAIVGQSFSSDGDVPANTGRHGMVAELSLGGQINWVRTYGGILNNEKFNSISKATGGGYVIGGYSENGIGDIACPKGAGDAWLMRLDSNGDIVWTKSLGSTYSDEAAAVIETYQEEFVFLGSSGGNNNDVLGHHGPVSRADTWIAKVGITQLNVSIAQSGCGEGGVYTLTASGGEAHCATYAWSTGETSASITVSNVGEYCVTATAPNGFSNATCFTLQPISPIQASFSYQVSPTNCYRVGFTPSVTGGTAPYTYLWDFGGATPNTSTSALPVNITYPGLGGYNALLTVTDANGCTATTSMNFELGETCNLSTINFCHTLTPTATGFTLTIDGVESDCNGTARTQYSYNGGATWTTARSRTFTTPGTYSICVKVRCAVCGVTCEQVCCKEINIGSPCNIPTTADLTGITVNRQSGLVTFTASALSPAATSYDWDFENDGYVDEVTTTNTTTHTYAPGTYAVKVYIRRSVDCYKMIVRNFIVEPACNVTSKFTATYCSADPLMVTFTYTGQNATNCVWQTQGGTSNGLSTTRTYNGPGLYKVICAAVTDEPGCGALTAYWISVGDVSCQGARPMAQDDENDLDIEPIDAIIMEDASVNEILDGEATFKNGLSLFPNPASGQSILQYNSLGNQGATIEVLDLSGRVHLRLVTEFTAGENLLTIPLGTIDTGLYCVRFAADGKLWSERLSVIH